MLETQGALQTPHAWIPPQRFQCNWREDLEIKSSRGDTPCSQRGHSALDADTWCGEVQEGTDL